MLPAPASPAAPPIGPAQGPLPTPPTLRVTSRLVVLDVVVVDREGHFVANLDRSQFTVTEDKIPQAIRSFEGPEDHAMPAATAGQVVVHSTPDLPRIGSAPVNVLVIDELNTPYMQIAYAQQSLRRFLEQQPEVLPTPTLFVASGASRITVLHDFTQSRADLLESVKKHVSEADFDAMINQLNGGKTGSQNGFAKTLGALSQIASSLRGIPGHKNVIWVGTGYNNAFDLNSMSASDADKTQAAVRLVTNRLLESRIALSTIDPAGTAQPAIEDQNQEADFADGGVGTGAFGGADGAVSFNTLARSTGGAVLGGRNDIDAMVSTATHADTFYYTLSYVPTNHSDDARVYRNIRVVVKDPSLRAITRTGYFAGADIVDAVAPNTQKSQPQQLRFDLLSAARTKLTYTGLHMEAQRGPRGYQLRITAKDLRWQTQPDGSRNATVTVLAVCFGSRDKELAQHSAQLTENISATDNIEHGAEVGFDLPLTVPTGTTRIRFVARDAATGALGAIDQAP